MHGKKKTPNSVLKMWAKGIKKYGMKWSEREYQLRMEEDEKWIEEEMKKCNE